MRVMMLSLDFPPRTLGGEGVFAGAVAPLLRDRGIDLDVVAPAAPGAAEHDAGLGLRVHRIPVAGGNFITRTRSFVWHSRKLVRAYGGDLVYTLRPIVRPRQPMVSHFHTTRRGQMVAAWKARKFLASAANALFMPVDRSLARRSALVLGVNANMRAELGCDRHPAAVFAVVANGIDTTLFTDAGRTPLEGHRLLFVGRLDPLKRIPDLLQAMAMAVPHEPRLQLSIVGAGRERERLLGTIDRLGLRDRVRIVSPVPHRELPRIYREHDVLVLPSAYESFGLVLLEAMACGTPVISSDACADLGQPTFRVGDWTGLAKGLIAMINDSSAPATRSAAVRGLAACHGWDRVADSLCVHFERVLASIRR